MDGLDPNVLAERLRRIDIDDGKTYQTVANVMLVVGSVGVAAGVGLFVWDVLDSPSTEEAEAKLRIGVGPGQLTLGGSF